MHRFTNDYSEGAHPRVMEALLRTNLEQHAGYTADAHCDAARALILAACGLGPDEASIGFVAGGTAANVIALNGLLRRPYDSVICTPDGHINTHETGALEACGHKVIATSATDGFLRPADADAIVRANAMFGHHMTRPTVLYVSQSTELGGIYSRDQLRDLSDYAHDHGMKLFVDGARLGSALTSPAADMTLPELARMADAFYIGGTKNGLLMGEAVVMLDPGLRADFPYLQKRHANLAAKGRVMGVMFEEAFRDGLWFECARNANERAAELRDGLNGMGFHEWMPSQTNQLFYTVPDATATAFNETCGCEFFFDLGDRKVIRFVTSWATEPDHVREALTFAQGLER